MNAPRPISKGPKIPAKSRGESKGGRCINSPGEVFFLTAAALKAQRISRRESGGLQVVCLVWPSDLTVVSHTRIPALCLSPFSSPASPLYSVCIREGRGVRATREFA